MAFDNIYVKGSQSIIIQVMLRDSTTGMGKTGIAYNTAGFTAYYCRNSGTAQTMTLVTMTIGTWASLGWIEVDATNMPGLYQFGVPNAALLTGANSVEFSFKGTGVLSKSTKIILVDADLRDAVRLGVTALPNAAANAANGLFTRGTGAGQINQDANGRIDANLDAINTDDSKASMLGSIIDESLMTINANVIAVNNVAIPKLHFTDDIDDGDISDNGTYSAFEPLTTTLTIALSAAKTLTSILFEGYKATFSGGAYENLNLIKCIFRKCWINFSGGAVTSILNGSSIEQSTLIGQVRLQNAVSHYFNNCLCGDATVTETFYISPVSGSAFKAFVKDCKGMLCISNMDHANQVLYIYDFAGHLIIDNTCSAGTIKIYGGSGTIINSGTGTTSVKYNNVTLAGSGATYNIPAKVNDIDAAVSPLAVEANVKGHVDDALTDYNTTGVAKEDSVLAIQNNTNFVASIAAYYLIPAVSANVYKLRVCLYDNDGNMEDPDNSDFALLMETAGATSKNALLFKEFACSTPLGATAVTGLSGTHKKLEKESTGIYFCFVKIASTETVAQFMYDFAIEEAAVLKHFTRTNLVLAEEPGTATLADNTTNADIVAKALKTRDVSATGAVTGSIYADIASYFNVVGLGLTSISNSILGVSLAVGTVVARIGAFTGSGVNTIFDFFRALFRNDITGALIPSDINADLGGSGVGTFDPTTDSVEAIAEKAATLATYNDMSLFANALSAELFRMAGIISNGRPQANVRYVDGKYLGFSDGISWGSPYKTIGLAMADLDSTQGGYVFVKNTQYFEDVVVPSMCVLVGINAQNGYSPGDVFAEIRGGNTDNPSLTLEDGAKAINIRVGKYQSPSSVIECVILMKDNTELTDGSTGGINKVCNEVIYCYSKVIIRRNHIDTSERGINAIGGFGNVSFIEDNLFTHSGNANNTTDLINLTSGGTIIRRNKFNPKDGQYAIVGTMDDATISDNVWNPENTGEFIRQAGLTRCNVQDNEQWAKDVDMQFVRDMLENNQDIIKDGAEFYLVTYDDAGTVEICRQLLKNFDGDTIDDLVDTGEASRRGRNSV